MKTYDFEELEPLTKEEINEPHTITKIAPLQFMWVLMPSTTMQAFSVNG